MIRLLTTFSVLLGVPFLVDHEPKAKPTCCLEEAYCCLIQDRCCETAADNGAIATVPTEASSTATPTCCAKRAFCCSLHRPCCDAGTDKPVGDEGSSAILIGNPNSCVTLSPAAS